MRRALRKVLFAAALCAAPAAMAASAAAPSVAADARRDELIERLGLVPLNGEAGLFRVLRVSDLEVTAGDGRSPASNAIYFMLTPASPQNHLHWLYSDDYQSLIEGGPADYYLFLADGSVAHYVMGRDVAHGQTPFVPVPAGAAKAIVLRPEAPYLLVGSVLTPAWSPGRERIGGDAAFIERYAGKAAWATPAFLRALIGPNFGQVLGAEGQDLSLVLDAQGQILWAGLQLTEQQAAIEIRKHAGAGPSRPLHIRVERGAPDALLQRLRGVARDAGIEVDIQKAP
ncbi:cupin domain-containing protein [Solimonas variicoloris]|uniref:cupin domain-containing protein n=1 Tax=Solimonas variicoloris TaxID=254408 RepID=UPI000372D470|nr:cupin domain-containing protein [Solimonas variicoloris]